MNYIHLLLKKTIVNGKSKVLKDTYSIPIIVNYETQNICHLHYHTYVVKLKNTWERHNKLIIVFVYGEGASQVVLVAKNPPASAGNLRDVDSIPGLGRFPRGEHSNPLQYSCMENPMDSGAWQATIHWVKKTRTWLKWLGTCMHVEKEVRDTSAG